MGHFSSFVRNVNNFLSFLCIANGYEGLRFTSFIFYVYGQPNLYFQSMKMIYIEYQRWEDRYGSMWRCVSVWEDSDKVHIDNVYNYWLLVGWSHKTSHFSVVHNQGVVDSLGVILKPLLWSCSFLGL